MALHGTYLFKALYEVGVLVKILVVYKKDKKTLEAAPDGLVGVTLNCKYLVFYTLLCDSTTLLL